MTRLAIAVVAAIVPAVAGGCGHGSFLGATMPASCRGARAGASAAGERCVGWIFDRLAVVAVDDEYDDPDLRAYVTGVAERIAVASHIRAPIVRVVDRGEAPAYARPGYVYVTRELLAVLASEAELAGVVAHEMAHEASGHTADLLDAYPAITAGDGGVREARSRDDEATADERAVGYLAAAGYAPDAMRTALVALDRAATVRLRADVDALLEELRRSGTRQPTATPDPPDAITGAATTADEEVVVDERHRYPREIDSADPTHPAMAERIARVTRVIAGRTAGELAAERYRAAIAGVIVGSDPRRGSLVGSTWTSARLGLAVDLPAGWETDGEDQKVSASTPEHEATLWSVGKGWGDAVAATLSDTRRMTIARHRAIVGVARHDPGDERRSDLTVAMDAPRPRTGSAVAVITVGPRALAIYVHGADAERRLAVVLRRIRAIRADELAASTPDRLVFRPAPTAGTVGDIMRAVCASDAAPWLDDRDRRIAAGDPVKCVEK